MVYVVLYSEHQDKFKNLHVICNFVLPGFDLRPDQEDHPEVSAGVVPNGHGHRVTDGHRNGGNCDQIDMCYNIRELGLDIDWLLRLQCREWQY